MSLFAYSALTMSVVAGTTACHRIRKGGDERRKGEKGSDRCKKTLHGEDDTRQNNERQDFEVVVAD
jgi:hypothetical protein